MVWASCCGGQRQGVVGQGQGECGGEQRGSGTPAWLFFIPLISTPPLPLRRHHRRPGRRSRWTDDGPALHPHQTQHMNLAGEEKQRNKHIFLLQENKDHSPL